MGKKKKPSYRVVVADSRSPRDEAFIETIGHYNPLTDPPTILIDEEKALKWLRHGAQPTDTVERLLRKLGIMDKFRAPIEVVRREEVPTIDEVPSEEVAEGGEAVRPEPVEIPVEESPPEDEIETAGNTHKEPHS